MLIRYVGPFPAVDVPEAALYGLARDTSVEVLDGLAEALVESGAWTPDQPPAPPPASPATPAPPPAEPTVPVRPRTRTPRATRTTTQRRPSGDPKE